MIKDIEEKKAKITKAMTDVLEKYYETYEASSNHKDFDINKIERLMLDNQRKVQKVLEEANNELISNVEVGSKKNALNVE